MRVLVRQGDTLERIALRAMGSASFADLLATVNSLEYPFIVSDPNYDPNLYASGSVTVTLLSLPALTLPIGTQFSTPAGVSNEVRTYAATQTVSLSSVGQSASVTVACTIPGRYGNTVANTVTVSSNAQVSVINPLPITGGRIVRVKLPGDSILIPAQTAQVANTSARLTLTQYDDEGGVDLLLTPQHGLQWGADDLMATDGPDTIGGDIAADVATPLGSIPDDPGLGTLIPSALGLGGAYALERLSILAQGAALSDRRVQGIGAVSVQTSGTWALVGFPVTLRTGRTTAQVAVSQGGVA